jgi:hypothetical protein
MMTKKDYIAIARMLTEVNQSVFSHSTDQTVICAFQDGKRRAIEQAIYEFVRVAKADNPRFDADRFRTAVGLDK